MFKKTLVIASITMLNVLCMDVPENPYKHHTYTPSNRSSQTNDTAKKFITDRLNTIKNEQADHYVYRNTFLTLTVLSVASATIGCYTGEFRAIVAGVLGAIGFGGIGMYSKSQEEGRKKETDSLLEKLSNLEKP